FPILYLLMKNIYYATSSDQPYIISYFNFIWTMDIKRAGCYSRAGSPSKNDLLLIGSIFLGFIVIIAFILLFNLTIHIIIHDPEAVGYIIIFYSVLYLLISTTSGIHRTWSTNDSS